MSLITVENNLIRVAGHTRVFNRIKILLTLMIPLAMAVMAISSISVALPTIKSAIGASDSSVQWMLSGYALVFGMVLVAAGRIGDTLGHGSVWIIGMAIFSLGSLACGLANSPLMLNIARLVQGFGAGVYNPQTTGMIQQYFRGQARAKAFSIFGLVISASVTAGPLLTGLIIRAAGPNIGWRASFIWTFPLGIIGAVLALRWFPFETERHRHQTRREGGAPHTRLDIDPVAIVLLAAAVLCIMLPFILKTGPAFALLAPAAVLLAAWLRWERAYKAHGRQPMVDLALFHHRSFTHGTAISGTQFLGSTSVLILAALFLQNGMGASALATGMLGLPYAIITAVTSLLTGRMALTKGRTIVITGLSCMTIGVIGTAVTARGIEAAHISFWWLILPLSLIGFGSGCMTGCNQTLSMAEIPPAEGGVAGGIKSTAERIATAIGNAITTAIFYSLVSRGWATALTSAYAAIALFIAASTALAVFDRISLGRGAGQAVPTP
ncbi:MFS transporter [Propionibacterium australiense]|uniref:MFS transporter n=1 Tax=Propionibacterium australiense TaxID=119981 RepID=A0A383S335_9ACTN|nr:MFS transporter [Propionibacterium australiense]RLP11550.1 MFS transporter [Propionibacterium australiense]RLP12716.1 MFS transporter [Propionibacterium australiense]SYZ32263.1 Major Facilitator Superfamily [Propionibacterium australiense]VEH90559.1 Spectinomycin tetracycline efflux pump [Propionibacterium australiense]